MGREALLDLHCHILPGVDDGAASLDKALAMARFCVRDGITHIATTPHCHCHLRLLRADILPHVARLNEELAWAGIPLAVLAGSELQLTDSASYRSDCEAGLYCHLGDGSTFTLLKFGLEGRLLPCRRAGPGKLAARSRHDSDCGPSRAARVLPRRPGPVKSMVEAGAWLQVTVDSLLGNHRPPPVASEELVATCSEVVLATDAHDLPALLGPVGRVRLGSGRDLAARGLRTCEPGRTRCWWRWLVPRKLQWLVHCPESCCAMARRAAGRKPAVGSDFSGGLRPAARQLVRSNITAPEGRVAMITVVSFSEAGGHPPTKTLLLCEATRLTPTAGCAVWQTARADGPEVQKPLSSLAAPLSRRRRATATEFGGGHHLGQPSSAG